ncbi:MAG TPA: NAD(P)/FAD-dependent oxidoreductase [Nitrososphaera sp.]|nr:NAD(P)/FAD-dependent oxidoreductase [Nitrososphaera sp.]
MQKYDVVVAGGSISGLLAAREAASGGASVAVLEEDAEIGTPEHCGGLVSISGIADLGIVPNQSGIENNQVKKARILSPGSGFEISAEKQKVIVLDRRALDKQVAFQSQKKGAEIRVKCSMRAFEKSSDGFAVKTSDGDISCRYFVDARGVASIISRNREGVLQSAQFEVYAPWIDRNTIEVVFDNMRYPGFFAWIIPTGEGMGKVGVAGKGINAASALNSYIESKGGRGREGHSIIRKVFAPIWVDGPIQDFQNEGVIIVGDAAGQSKPTTAGGIYTCGMGGMFAGQAIARALNGDKEANLKDYQRNWLSVFKSEFDKMLLARRLLERLDNKAIDELFAAVPSEKIEEAAATGDFDFHSAALAKILGAKAAAKMAKAILGNEIRRLIDI